MQFSLEYTEPKKLLNPAGGYLTGYTHTLNPYAGCSFACAYCYVRQMPVAFFQSKPWGSWVKVKNGAAALLRKELAKAKSKGPVTVFMSSSTDPYQPVEHKLQITRSLLSVMADEKPDFLLVQTRSPLITRDLDILSALRDRVRVSMTIETDLEAVRKAFTPSAPPLAARFKALKKMDEAGIPAQAAVSPLLPCSDKFAEKLAESAGRIVLDDFFMGDGSKGKRTEKLGIRQRFEELGLGEWYHPEAYLRVLEELQKLYGDDRLFVSQKGFLP